jgi:hypothetical protein
MAEMREMGCPECEKLNHPKSIAEGILEYRCRSCGLVYYGPCGCDTAGPVSAVRAASGAAPLPEGWRMSGRLTVADPGAATPSFAGGC